MFPQGCRNQKQRPQRARYYLRSTLLRWLSVLVRRLVAQDQISIASFLLFYQIRIARCRGAFIQSASQVHRGYNRVGSRLLFITPSPAPSPRAQAG